MFISMHFSSKWGKFSWKIIVFPSLFSLFRLHFPIFNFHLANSTGISHSLIIFLIFFWVHSVFPEKWPWKLWKIGWFFVFHDYVLLCFMIYLCFVCFYLFLNGKGLEGSFWWGEGWNEKNKEKNIKYQKNEMTNFIINSFWDSNPWLYLYDTSL